MNSPTATLALRNPSPTVMRKAIKSPERARKLIARHLGNGTLKSVRKFEDRVIVTFYLNSTYSNYRQWAWNPETANEVKKQDSVTYVCSTCVALVPFVAK
jgi:hypothetical protein